MASAVASGCSTLPMQSQVQAQVDASSLVPVLQQLTQALTQLTQVLQSQQLVAGGGGAEGGCGGAAAGAAALGAPTSLVTTTGGGAQAGTDAWTLSGSPVSIAPAAADRLESAATPAPVALAPAPAPASTKGQEAVEYARQFLGKPYVYAAAGPDAFDCSGLTKFVMKHFGVDLPHHAADQAKMGTPVDRKDLQPGDLVFLANGEGGSIGHVMIYAGDGKVIQAPKTGDVVKVSDLDSSYIEKYYAGARRFL